MSRFFDKALAGLEPYVPGEQPDKNLKVIKLNTNENPFPPGPNVIAAIDSVRGMNLYPDPDCKSLRESIGEYMNLDIDNVFVGNGSDEVLAFCFQGFCPRGAALNNITYGFYTVFASLYGKSQHIINLREDFSISPKDYLGVKETLLIANPNAPTGLALTPSQIEEILMQDSDRLVIVDEAYVDFGAQSVVPLINRFDNLLVIQTMSKSRSLAGERLGMAFGDKSLIDDLNTLKFSFNPYNINNVTTAAGIAAIKDISYFEKCRNKIISTREYATLRLAELGFTLTDSRANFIFGKPPKGYSSNSYREFLRDRNILIRYWDKDRIRDWVRITVGTRKQMDALLEATKDFLEEMK